jgi:hypothetical protein
LEITDLPAHLTVIKLQGDEQVECHFCNASTKLKDMRNHVGKHILCAFRGVEDPSLKASISVNPCGWCGRQGCKVQLIKKGTSNSISSSCPYHYSKMMYGRAAQYSKSSPCTNVPIHCPLCLEGLSGQPKTIWKYNAFAHFAAEHVPLGSDSLPEIPSSFIVDTFISSKEESDMGIGQQSTQDHRDQYNIPGTDGFEEEMKKRERAESVVSTEPPRKAARGIDR